MKNTKIYKNNTNLFHYLTFSFFAVSSIMLGALLAISYVYGIIKYFNKLDLGNLNNYNNVGAKIFTIIFTILLFVFILAVICLSIYGLYKASLRYLQFKDNNNLIYFVFAKRWVDAIVSIVLGFVTLFGINYLFKFTIPWFNYIFSICLACVYFLVGIVVLVCYIYYSTWLKKQPEKFKKSYQNIANQINNSKQEMKELKESSKIDVVSDTEKEDKLNEN